MFKKYPYDRLGRGRHGLLNTHYHFSCGDYHNPKRNGIGPLLAVNDNMIHPSTGFAIHEQEHIELITYVVSGELKFINESGQENIFRRGDIFYMNCGVGLTHSVINNDPKTILRYYQISVKAKSNDTKPEFKIAKFKWMDRINNWFLFAATKEYNTPIQLNQNINMYCSYLIDSIMFEVKDDYTIYLVLIEGELVINDEIIEHGDAIEFKKSLLIKPTTFAHVIIFEIPNERIS